MSARGTLRRLFVLVLLAALALVLVPGAGSASAHAFLVSSNPADGQVLDSAPSELRLRLSEAVLLGSTSVTVVGGAERLELTDLHLRAPSSQGARQPPGGVGAEEPGAEGVAAEGTGADGAGPGGVGAGQGPGASALEAPVELVAALPPLPRGSYRVSLETVSADDLHRTAAVLVFGVQEQVSAAGRQEAAPRLDEALLRWVVLSGLSLGLGAALVRRLARPARHPSVLRVTTAADRVAASACALAALTALALLAVQVWGEGGAGFAALRGAYGARWLTREAGLLGLAAAALLRQRPAGRLATSVVFGLGAVLATVGESLLGHAGAGVTTSWARVAATALHIGAASTWAGTAVLLTGCTWALRREGVPGRALARALLRRFGLPAAGCVSVMVVTGVFLASTVVASVDAVLVTEYGRVLLAKLLVTLTALLLGLFHARSLHPRLRLHGGRAGTSSRTPGRSLLAEGVAAAAVLALAALLAAGQPAIGPELVADPAATFDSTVSAFADDLQEQLSIQPNRPGPNIALVTTSTTRRPDPAPVTGVSVAVYAVGGGLRSVGTGERSAPGQWSVPLSMTEAGPATAVVTVTRSGMPPTVLPVDWVVAQTRPPRAVLSLASLTTGLQTAALVLTALLLVLWGAVVLRLRRRRQLHPPTAITQRAGHREGQHLPAGSSGR